MITNSIPRGKYTLRFKYCISKLEIKQCTSGLDGFDLKVQDRIIFTPDVPVTPSLPTELDPRLASPKKGLGKTVKKSRKRK